MILAVGGQARAWRTDPPRFLTPLDVRRRDDGRWVLIAPLIFESAVLGLVTVPRGFDTDFASVPRVPFAFLVAGDRAHEAAVLHDAIYRRGEVRGEPITRALADEAFRDAMEATGEPWWRRRVMWAAVRVAGGGPWARYRRGLD
jgi:hypothetical protein